MLYFFILMMGRPDMDKRVLVIGSTCVDVIIRVDHLPKTEENMHPHSQTFQVGGCAYNIAFATLGHIVGGAIMVGMVYWISYRKKNA